MSQEDIDDKREGGYLTGLPLINFDMTKGLGLGGRLTYYQNGRKDSPLFEYTPYRHAVAVRGFASTGGWQKHKIDYDAINIGDSPYRLRAEVFYERNIQATYYGVGAGTMGELHWSGTGRTYATMRSLESDLSTQRADGTVGTRYNQYDMLRPGMGVAIERNFLAGYGRALLGATVRHARISTYDGQSVDADVQRADSSNAAIQGPTLLAEDCASNRIAGCRGGWDNVLRLAVSLDARDYEPDPNVGFFLAMSGQVSSKLMGSTHPYARVSLTLHAFHSPFRRVTDLVLAGRIAYQVQSARTPFHSMSTLTFPVDDVEGLGGARTLRGYQQNRFVGPVLSLANAEIRWTPFKFRALKQLFGIGVVPFLDMGRVYDRVELRFSNWRFGYGVGMRVAWNQATIVAADYGFSTEDHGFALTLGHPF